METHLRTVGEGLPQDPPLEKELVATCPAAQPNPTRRFVSWCNCRRRNPTHPTCTPSMSARRADLIRSAATIDGRRCAEHAATGGDRPLRALKASLSPLDTESHLRSRHADRLPPLASDKPERCGRPGCDAGGAAITTASRHERKPTMRRTPNLCYELPHDPEPRYNTKKE